MKSSSSLWHTPWTWVFCLFPRASNELPVWQAESIFLTKLETLTTDTTGPISPGCLEHTPSQCLPQPHMVRVSAQDLSIETWALETHDPILVEFCSLGILENSLNFIFWPHLEWLIRPQEFGVLDEKFCFYTYTSWQKQKSWFIYGPLSWIYPGYIAAFGSAELPVQLPTSASVNCH